MMTEGSHECITGLASGAKEAVPTNGDMLRERAYHAPGSVLSPLLILSHLSLPEALGERCYQYPYFAGGAKSGKSLSPNPTRLCLAIDVPLVCRHKA